MGESFTVYQMKTSNGDLYNSGCGSSRSPSKIVARGLCTRQLCMSYWLLLLLSLVSGSDFRPRSNSLPSLNAVLNGYNCHQNCHILLVFATPSFVDASSMVNMMSSHSMTESTVVPCPATAEFGKREQELKDLEAGHAEDKKKNEPSLSKPSLTQRTVSSLRKLVCKCYEILVHRNFDEHQIEFERPTRRPRKCNCSHTERL